MMENDFKKQACDGLRQSPEGLSQLCNSFVDIARLLDVGQDQQAMQLIGDCLPHLQGFAGFINEVGRQLQLKPESGLLLQTLAQRLQSNLEALLQALSVRDYIRASDLLLYKLCPLSEEYIELLPQIAEEVA